MEVQISQSLNVSNTEENVAMYFQWRPISYTTSLRDVTDSIEVIHYPLKKSLNSSKDTSHTILYPYYREKLDSAIVQRLNVSFGIKGDSFYKNSAYTSW